MRVKFFAVPALASAEAESELNRFLASHRVVTVEREFALVDEAPFWFFAVTHLAAVSQAPKRGKERIDYKQVLSEDDFSVFAELRSLRKAMAEEEGVPPYALFTNEQLSEIVTRPVTSLEELRALPGVGPARVEKHGMKFLSALKDLRSVRSDGEDHV